MPSTSRPYVRKTKGCYQCSRRRIHCDRTEPACQKCTTKGLHCTGLGLRIRFSYGNPVPARAVPQEGASSAHQSLKASEDPSHLDALHRSSDVKRPLLLHASAGTTDAVVLASDRLGVSSGEDEEDAGIWVSTRGRTLAPNHDTTLMTISASTPSMILPPEQIPRWKLMMCLHFSENIAPEMAAIDSVRNGWRSLVLPLAHSNDLVMGAVVTVSLHHVWLNWYRPKVGEELSDIKPDLRDPNKLYTRVIHRLQKLPPLTQCDLDTRISVLLTILVLLVGVMVTGRSDFRILSRMLESALEAVGGEEHLGNSAAAVFIKTQIHKFRLYSAPLLNEQMGMQVISSRCNTDQLLDCLTHSLSDVPQHSTTATFVKNVVQQAVDIYLDQARNEAKESPSTEMDDMVSILRVQQFIETIEAFPERTSCEQVLIWACFVAASGSVLPEHRTAFERILQRQYTRCGFENIRKGINQLQTIWHRLPDQRWTSLLAQTNILLM